MSVRGHEVASIPSPASSGFSLGPFEVHAYGLMYVVAVAVAMLMTVRRWEAQGGSRRPSMTLSYGLSPLV